MVSYSEDGPNLPVEIDTTIHRYEHEREKYWTAKGEASLIRAADQVAVGIVEAVFQDKPPDDHGMDLANHLLATAADRVSEMVEILMAREFSTHAMSERCLSLTETVWEKTPGERPLRFLRRLTRCYVAGFFPECVMLCRSVVEAAIDERLGDGDRPSRLREKLDLAVQRGLLSDGGRQTASTVRQRGNTAVHHDPTVTVAAWDTILLTLTVLEELYD
jgi:hypothetical protein